MLHSELGLQLGANQDWPNKIRGGVGVPSRARIIYTLTTNHMDPNVVSLISAVEGIEISTFDSPFGVGQKAAATTKREMLWSRNVIPYSGDPSS